MKTPAINPRRHSRLLAGLVLSAFVFGIVLHSRATSGRGDDVRLADFLKQAAKIEDIPIENRAARDQDRCEQPFLRANGEAGAHMPLRSIDADVRISGIVAHVELEQVFTNDGAAAIEATYVFPMSTRAAVHGMQMMIGDRIIEGEIKEKKKARKVYEKAKREGRHATLLEQERPNVFVNHVANIGPGETIRVKIIYTESLVPAEGEYGFVFPTAVVERFGMNPNGKPVEWQNNPYVLDENAWEAGRAAPTPMSFNLAIKLNGGLPVQKVSSPTHKIKTSFLARDRVRIDLDPVELNQANRDFILNYQLAGKQVDTGLLVHHDEELRENFFLLTMQPPKRVAPGDIPPREYVFVVDVSGSMSGFPLEISKTMMRALLHSLRPDDRFNIVLFAGSSRKMFPNCLPATHENIRKAAGMTNSLLAGGGTQLVHGLETAFDSFSDADSSKTMVVVTDGFVNFEQSTFNLIRNRLDHANLFAFGIGKNVNRHCIEGMAVAGRGEPWIATNPSEANLMAAQFVRSVALPVLTGLEVEYEGFEAYDVEPARLPDMFSDKPLVLTGKFRGNIDESAKAVVTGRSGAGELRLERNLDDGDKKENVALPFLWAREHIRELSDYRGRVADPGDVKEVTATGLKYNIVTEFTSFVAVEKLPEVDAHDRKMPKAPHNVPEPSAGILSIFAALWILRRRRNCHSAAPQG